MGTASWLIPARDDQPELLDQGEGTLDDVRTNLAEMWRMNALSGGIYALTRQLLPRLARINGAASVVDLGTGSGKLARLVAKWAAARRKTVRVVALDLSARHLSIARGQFHETPTVNPVQADVLALPFASGQIDYFVSSLFMHHFPPTLLVNLLRETYERSRRGIVMSDLSRGYLPLAGFHLIQPVFGRHYVTRYDGIVSIKRAYTAADLRILAREAGLTHARVIEQFPWRVTLVADKDHV